MRIVVVVRDKPAWASDLIRLARDAGIEADSADSPGEALEAAGRAVFVSEAREAFSPDWREAVRESAPSPWIVVADGDRTLPEDLGERAIVLSSDRATPARLLREAVAASCCVPRPHAPEPESGPARFERRSRLLEQAFELSLRVASCLDRSQAMGALLRGLRQLLTPARVSVYVQDDETGGLAQVGEDGAVTAGAARDAAGLLAEEIVRTGGDDLLAGSEADDLIGCPILLGGRAVGALVADMSACESHLELYRSVLAMMAKTGATALHVANRHEDTRKRSRHMTVLYELGRRMAAETELRDVLDMIVDNAMHMTGTERCALMLLDEQAQVLRIRARRNIPEDVAEAVELRVGEGVAGRVAATGEALLIRRPSKDPCCDQPAELAAYADQSLLSVPLKLRGHVTGVLNVTARSDDSDFTLEDEELLTLLASQAAVAIDNASLYRSLTELAATDGLTGLYNHQHFYSRLRGAVSLARRLDHPLAVIMADIDHFKRVNDTYGHAQGDVVLRAVASLLQGAVRKEDVAARYGGEEFAVILPNTTTEGACRLADRFCTRVRELEFTKGDATFSVTVSVGLAELEPDLSPEKVVDEADRALYAAKALGRDAICMCRDGEPPSPWRTSP